MERRNHRGEDGRKSATTGLDHLDGKRDVFERTSNGGFMAETGFESMPELPVIAQSAHGGGKEKKRKISPSEEHVGSCQHRRGEEERK